LERDQGGDSQSFQWTEMPRGDLLLLSLTSQRHLRINSYQNTVTADAPGATADRKSGSSFAWRIIATANEQHAINPH
jgi:hypothetical protein